MNNIRMYFDTDDIADGRLSPVQRRQITAMCKEHAEKKDRKYWILPEYVGEWTNSDNPEDWIVSLREIVRLANEWGVTVDELMREVEEM